MLDKGFLNTGDPVKALSLPFKFSSSCHNFSCWRSLSCFFSRISFCLTARFQLQFFPSFFHTLIQSCSFNKFCYSRAAISQTILIQQGQVYFAQLDFFTCRSLMTSAYFGVHRAMHSPVGRIGFNRWLVCIILWDKCQC